MASTSWCRCCGKEYKVCPTCAEVTMYKPWRVICDTAVHYKVWLTVSSFRKGVIDKATAKKQLSGMKLAKSEIATFLPEIQALIEKINEPDSVLVEEAEKPAQTGAKRVNKNKGRGK